jgi:hypothetical protein
MERIDPSQLKTVIMEAPGWARVGITAPSEQLRDRAAQELALSIADHLNGGPDYDFNQLALPL